MGVRAKSNMFFMSVILLAFGDCLNGSLCMHPPDHFCVVRSKPQREACASVVSVKLHCSRGFVFLF